MLRGAPPGALPTMPDPDAIDPFELTALEARGGPDVARLVAERRRLRRALAAERAGGRTGPAAADGGPTAGAALRRAEARADAAELDLERAHRLLDLSGVPREVRRAGERDPVELSLAGRLRLALDDDAPDEL